MKRKLILTFFVIAAVLLVWLQIVLASSNRAAAGSPTVIAAITPPYPLVALAAHVGGEVTVEVVVNSKGEVISTKASGHQLLAEAAERATKQWRFAPVTDSSNPTATLTFAFQLMPRCASVTDLTPVFYPPYKVEVRGEKPPIICDDCSPAERERLRCKNP
jgi:TonB family protein